MEIRNGIVFEKPFAESAVDVSADRMGIGPCIDVACHGDYIYALTSIMGDSLSGSLRKKYFAEDKKYGALNVFHIEKGGSARQLSFISGLGNVRQIIVASGYAYITAREDGLYIIDVSNPEKPVIACHHDTVEFATGIAVYGKVAAVGCRTFGVELIDVSCPQCPRHISTFRSGEVQSIYIDKGILYTGSWSESEVLITDIRDALHPTRLGRVELDGRGDGLFVRDGLLYAATGHHSRKTTPSAAESEYYGAGNGFEIFDVSNPASPRLLSRTKLVDKYYFCCFDMWKVSVAYPYAYVNDTFNGLYVFDISSPEKPSALAHYVIRLPVETNYFQEKPTSGRRVTVLPFDYTKEMFGPVCGAAFSEGRAYIAGGISDLHTAVGEYFHPIPDVAPESVPLCDYYDLNPGEGMDGCTVIRTPGQARAAAWHGGYLYAACGEYGIAVYNEAYEFTERIKTDGCAMDVCFNGKRMYTAEGDAGLGIYEAIDGRYQQIGRYNRKSRQLSQAVVSANGVHALLQCECTDLVIVNVSDPSNIYEELCQTEFPGLLYGRQISITGQSGRYYSCHWNANVNHWYDLGGDSAVELPDLFRAFECCAYRDSKTLAVAGGGYTIFDCTADNSEAPEIHRIKGHTLNGKPSLYGDKLFVTNRSQGLVWELDIADIDNPAVLRAMKLTGHPDIAVCNEKTAAIPAGYQGIVLFQI